MDPLPITRYKATAEHVDDNDTDSFSWSYETTPSTPHSSTSRNSYVFDDSFEISEAQPSASALCRRDTVNDIALSKWGMPPPTNFAQVMTGVYRSGFPKQENFPFLRQLNLKSVLTLVAEEYPESSLHFLRENNIQHFQVCIEANKDPFVTIPENIISAALSVVLNPDNYPLLIHCNKGKHRTGCVVGCARKIIGWELSEIFHEYRRYAAHKARVLDERFIERFDQNSRLWMVQEGALFDTQAYLEHHELPPDSAAERPIAALALPNSTRLRG